MVRHLAIDRIAIAFSLIILSAFGCAKKPEGAAVRVQMPDWSELKAKAAETIANKGQEESQAVIANAVVIIDRVMINITGPGMPGPAITIWEQDHDSDESVEPPAEFALDVPKGSNRLVQVLIIVKESQTSDSSVFYYGDQLKNVSTGVEPVAITVNRSGSGLEIDGRIKGRYIEADGTGPTGFIDLYFTPPNGSPQMIVDSEYAFGGWFQEYGTRGIQFSYRFRGGPVLAENLDIESPSWPLGQALLRYHVPVNYRPNGNTRRTDSESIGVVGFFGPGASGKAICYQSGSESIANMYVSPSPGNQTLLQWGGQTQSTAVSGVNNGGISHSTPACPDGFNSLWSDHLVFDHRQLSSGEPPFFSGPFRHWSGGNFSGILKGERVGTDVTVTWKYLPGVVGAEGISGVGVFERIISSAPSNSRDIDTVACENISSLGFSEVKRVDGATESVTIAGVTPAIFDAGRYQIALCPYRTGHSGYMPSGIQIKRFASASLSGGPATQLVVHPAGQSPTTSVTRFASAQNSCLPMVIEFLDTNGNIANRSGASGAIQATVVSPANVELYPTELCGGSSVNSLIVPMTNGRSFAYYKPLPASSTFDITVTDTSVGGVALSTTTYHGIKVSAPAPSQIRAIVPSSIRAHHDCAAITLQAEGDMGGGVMIPSNVAGSQTVSLPTGFFQYFTDPGCTSGSSPSTLIGSSSSTKTIYARYVGSNASETYAPTSGMAVISATIAIVQPGAPVTLRLDLGSTLPAETCVPVWLRAVDSSGYESPAIGTQTVNALLYNSQSAPTLSGFYLDSNCATPTTALGLSNGTSRSNYYMRFVPQIAVAVTGNSIDPTMAFAGGSTTFGTPAVARIAAYPSGATYVFSNNTYGGYIPLLLETSTLPFSLYLEAFTSIGNLLPSFNISDSGPSGFNLTTNFGNIISCAGPPTWAAGQATMTGCWINNGSGVGAFIQLQTGGGTTGLPFHSGAQVFVAEQTDAASTYFYSHSFRHASGNCQPLLIGRGHPISGGYMSAPVLSQYTAPLAGTNVAWWTDRACTVSAGSNITIPASNSATILYAGLSSPAPSGLQADTVPIIDPALGSAPTFTSGGPGTLSQYSVVTSGATVAGACVPVMIASVDGNGTSVALGAGAVISLTGTAGLASAIFYSDAFCATPTATLALSAGDRAGIVYMRIMSSSGTGGINVSDGSFSGSQTGIAVY